MSITPSRSPVQQPIRPVALVTGAARGIGRAIALELARRGHDLALADLALDATAEATLDELHEAGAATAFIACDLADIDGHPARVAAVVEHFGRLDCLVNNAGIAAPVRGDLLALKPEHFDRVLDVNLRGTFFLTQAVANAMLAVSPAPATPRTIVTISSVSAAAASPERAEYCLSKAGLAMMVKLFALRMAEAGIAVFEVRPGIIRTAMTEGVGARYDRLIADGLVPARRWGAAEDIGRVVGGLVGGDFAFATGTVVEAGGGLAITRL